MPSGYTAAVEDGTVTEFSEFLHRCAQAFIIDMRDSAIGSPIPEVSTWSVDNSRTSLNLSLRAVATIQAMTDDDLLARQDRERADLIKELRKAQVQSNLKRHRYEAMRSKVSAWDAPDELEAIQTFMLSQLDESIRHDCHDYHDDILRAEVRGIEPVGDYRARLIREAEHRVERDRQSLAEAEERYAHNQHFRDVLMAELGKALAAEAVPADL